MVTSRQLYLLLLGLLACERLLELVVSRRNARRAFERGGYEVGAPHFRAMARVHALFIPACAAEVLLFERAFPGALGGVALAGALLAQGLRYWALTTLGDRWNVRIIVVPGAEPVTRGPYRFLRHPNYLAVILEMACVPLIHGAWLSALAFSAANASLLRRRIPAEEQALGMAYQKAFGGKARFLPAGSRARVGP